MTYLTRSKAAEYLAKHLPDKNAPSWAAFLNENARTTRKRTFQIPFERDGLLAYYDLKELGKFIKQHKRKTQQTTFKLPPRKTTMSAHPTESRVEAVLEAFGVTKKGSENENEHGQAFGRMWAAQVSSIVGNLSTEPNRAAVQLIVSGDPLRVYALSIYEAEKLVADLQEVIYLSSLAGA